MFLKLNIPIGMVFSMETIQFAPLIDLPLVAVTIGCFLMNFNVWARDAELDTVVNLADRLPRARLLMISFFIVLLLICWLTGIAVWVVYGLFVAVGTVLPVFAGGAPSPSSLPMFVANLIREWCFGFPQLILQPDRRPNVPLKNETEDPLVGRNGIAVSSLRPTGVVELEGREVQAVSESGAMIETGESIVVTGRRSGLLSVRAER